ncbi:MAG TPA: glycosyl transferase family 2, partial [Planctomycetaceae bacterium]|nr:glycosyl transferase family 2 [Planctomycetaceae bacterium]
GQQLVLPSPNSKGLAIDRFSAEATRMHFRYFIDRLRQQLGPLERTALRYLYLCSYELRGRVWTTDMLQAFRARRGYDMKPYLPTIVGASIEDRETTERFMHDFRETLSDLLIERFYAEAARLCQAAGLELCAEAGGPGPPLHNVPVDALKAQGRVDRPRGEFWNQYPIWVVKETACAAHIYGKPVVDMEAFTSWRHWQDGPFELKPLADRAFCEGANHFTFHTWPHQPPEAGQPGWAYHAGTHVGPTRLWWPMAKPFIDYLARCSSLLQQGRPVADVCYYYGDGGYKFVPPKHIDPSLGFGYDYDVTNTEVLCERMSVRDGRIVLPGGPEYAILVLPDQEAIEVEVLSKLEQLVRRGATVVGRKPTRSHGLFKRNERDRQVRELADRIWGPCEGQRVLEHRYGEGRVVWGRSLRELLAELGVGPDFSFTSRRVDTELDFVHRRSPEADIYFVWNKQPRWQWLWCKFRVSGRQPELWLPDSGEIRRQLIYRTVKAGIELPLRLPPLGSVFVLFRRQLADPPAANAVKITDLRHNGRSLLPG